MMQTKYIKGKEIAGPLKKAVKAGLKELAKPPKLVSLLVGDAPDACYYAESQRKQFERIGVPFEIRRFPANADETQIIAAVTELNQTPEVTGILQLMPLPCGVDHYRVRSAIAPHKDVEGVTPTNMGNLYYGDFAIAPCTAKAVYLILEHLDMELKGQEIVVVSHSEIVGKPLLTMLLHSERAAPTPTCCHIATRDLTKHLGNADIVVAAAGKAGLIRGEALKPGAVVIDVGINLIKGPDGQDQVVGDVDAASTEGIASVLTPVPGGVGTVTTAVLMQNCLTLAQRQNNT